MCNVFLKAILGVFAASCRERKHLTFTVRDSRVCVGIERSLRIKSRKSVELNLDVVVNHGQFFSEQANPQDTRRSSPLE